MSDAEHFPISEKPPRSYQARDEILQLMKSKPDITWRDIQKIVGKYFSRKYYIGKPFLKAVERIVQQNVVPNLSSEERRRLERMKVEYEQRMRDQIKYDELTQVLIRRYALGELPKFVERNSKSAIMMIDLDHFNDCNNTYGHQKGDEVLREFGRQLNAIFPIIPEGDAIVGRYGGEEFIVVLPEHVNSVDDERLNSLRDNFRQYTQGFTNTGSLFKGTLSTGIYNADFSDSTINIDTAIKFADESLYKAKETRDTIKIWEPPKIQ